MQAFQPEVVHIPVDCAFKTAPCPQCGRRGRRKRVRHRQVRTLAYKKLAYLDVTYGEYQARCGCCTTFHNHPDDVLPKGHYDNRVREAVLDRILDCIPVGRLGKPEEIASIVAWLASDEAGFATGADFPVNGGMHMF